MRRRYHDKENALTAEAPVFDKYGKNKGVVRSRERQNNRYQPAKGRIDVQKQLAPVTVVGGTSRFEIVEVVL